MKGVEMITEPTMVDIMNSGIGAQINADYEAIAKLREDVYHSVERAIFMRTCQQSSFAKDMTTGKCQGKNVDERMGAHRELRPKLYRWLAEAERDERYRKMLFDVQQYRLEMTRAYLRILELTHD
jgi:hypothetical protein